MWWFGGKTIWDELKEHKLIFNQSIADIATDMKTLINYVEVSQSDLEMLKSSIGKMREDVDELLAGATWQVPNKWRPVILESDNAARFADLPDRDKRINEMLRKIK